MDLCSGENADHRRERPVVESQTLLLRELNQEEIPTAVDLTWQLFNDPANRSYPLFHSQGEITTEYASRLEERNAALLGCFRQRRLIGLLCYFFHPGEQYLQTTAFTIAEDYDTVASTFVKYLGANFGGYDIYVGVTAENTCAAEALQSNGYELIEASLDMRLGRSQFIDQYSSSHEIVRIDRTGLEEYAGFHMTHFGDIYWTIERLRKNIDQWTILALKTEGKINGGIFLRSDASGAEIFGMASAASAGEHAASALLSQALRTVFDENPNVDEVVFFTDEDDRFNQRAALSNGFRCHSRYRCYRNT